MIVVHEPRPPLWKRIVAAGSFSLALLLISQMIFPEWFYDESYFYTISTPQTIIILLVAGLQFSITRGIEIDTTKRKYRKTISLSWMLYGRWQDLMQIDYFSYFPQPLKDGAYIFEVNLWYEKNKHFCVFEHKDKGVALDFGIELAKELNSKLLNATQRGNYTWVDLTKV